MSDREQFELDCTIPHWALFMPSTNEYICNAQHRIEHCHRLNAKWEGYRAAWQHQQAKIDALEARVQIYKVALEEIETIYKSYAASIAHDALLEVAIAEKDTK